MKTFFQVLLKHTSDMVARLIVWGGVAYGTWWLFDEEVRQVGNWLIDTLDRIF